MNIQDTKEQEAKAQQEREERERSARNANDLLWALTGYGRGDIETAADWLSEAGLDYNEFGTYVENWQDETGFTPSSDGVPLDICALALQFIVREAAGYSCKGDYTGLSEIEERIYGNYMCSSIDIDSDMAGSILYAIAEDERGTAWEWLAKFTDATQPKPHGWVNDDFCECQDCNATIAHKDAIEGEDDDGEAAMYCADCYNQRQDNEQANADMAEDFLINKEYGI